MVAVIAAPRRAAPARLGMALLASLGMVLLVLAMHSLASGRVALTAPAGPDASASIHVSAPIPVSAPAALDRPVEAPGAPVAAACDTRCTPVCGTAADCVAAPNLVPAFDATPAFEPASSDSFRYRAPIDPISQVRSGPSPILLSVSRT